MNPYHPQRMLISSFNLENGTFMTPLFKFFLELGLHCTKFTVLFNIFLGNASMISFNQWLMQEEKKTKTFYQELQQKHQTFG